MFARSMPCHPFHREKTACQPQDALSRHMRCATFVQRAASVSEYAINPMADQYVLRIKACAP